MLTGIVALVVLWLVAIRLHHPGRISERTVWAICAVPRADKCRPIRCLRRSAMGPRDRNEPRPIAWGDRPLPAETPSGGTPGYGVPMEPRSIERRLRRLASRVLTPDQGGSAKTEDFARAVIANL